MKNAPMLPRSATLAILAAALVVLTAGSGVVGSASAAPSSGAPVQVSLLSAGVSNQWAYGVGDNLTASWTNSTLGYTGMIHAYFGLQVTLTQSNSSATTSEVELQRTVALDFDALFCKPTCTNPIASANLSYAAWQSAVGFVNFTTNGSVTVGGVSVPAIAISNASTRVVGNLTIQNVTEFHGLLGVLHTDTYYFTVQENDNLAVGFTPALGLLPASLTNVTAWNSSSAYTASGAWTAAYRYVHHAWNDTLTDVTYAPSGSLTSSGELDLYGTAQGPVTLSNGLVTQEVGLSLSGPFHLREGLLFVPDSSDVLASSGQTWSGLLSTGAATNTAGLDIGSRIGHLGILAGATSYAPSSSPVEVSGVTPAATSGGATVQAEPETVAESQSGSSCLIAGTCPGQRPGPGVASRPGLGGAGVVLVGVFVVAVIVGLLVVGRRRPVPPPPHPNALLYPPGAAATAPARVRPAATAPGKPVAQVEEPANDPLSNLW